MCPIRLRGANPSANLSYVALSHMLDNLKFAACAANVTGGNPLMTSLTRHVAITGAALATAGALVAAIPTINANHDLTLASSPAVTTVSSAIQLMSHSEWQGN